MNLSGPPTHTADGETIFSVSEINATSRQILESHFGQIYVAGEISNVSHPASGHQYFSLKDTRAQIRCAWFRGKNSTSLTLQDGAQVIVRASVSLYPERGDYQLIIESVIDAGRGLLMQQLEALKKKLATQGLFSATHKQPLPAHIQTIGIITSDTGAALQDILTVLKRRAPSIAVVVYASQVQGEQAPQQLITALQYANQQQACDVLILARGGGSLEDLWAFNDEALAYAIYNSHLPIISAIGHEVDFTIADWVADMRAATPSAAAELASPDQQALLATLTQLHTKLTRSITNHLENHYYKLEQLNKRLRHPRQTLQERSQRLDILFTRLNTLAKKLFQQEKQQVTQLEERLNRGINMNLTHKHNSLAKYAHILNTLSPLATLSRGYAMVQKEDQSIVTNSNQVKPSELVEITLSVGKIHCRVQ